jgi:hypothetical protein
MTGRDIEGAAADRETRRFVAVAAVIGSLAPAIAGRAPIEETGPGLIRPFGIEPKVRLSEMSGM